MNIYFFKFLKKKYSKCETCDHSDIPITYVTRKGVAAIFMMGSDESSQKPLQNAEHAANLRKPTAGAEIRQPARQWSYGFLKMKGDTSHDRGTRHGAKAAGSTLFGLP